MKTQGLFTLYPVIGDLFAWLAMVGFVVIAGWAILRRHGQDRAALSANVQTLTKKLPARPGQSLCCWPVKIE